LLLVRSLWFTTFLLAGLSPIAALQGATAAPDVEQLFARRIWPMFEDKCLACHGRDEEKIKAGLDLRTRATMLAGGDTGVAAVLPGKPAGSPLWRAITTD
jgi:hypothetical protein